ncbi:MAG: 50S ribosomal protein L19 [Patescibacteria group bacterium]|jgi:large subunit ribosomal protein L19
MAKDKKTTEKKEERRANVKKEEKRSIPDNIEPGMTIRIYQKIKEKNPKGEIKERVQYFEGMIIAKKHGKEAGASITVRKVSGGIGVEKIFPLNLPTITKIEIKKQSQVKRAKLYFLKRGYNKRLKNVPLKA